MNNIPRLIFDIETRPNQAAIDLLEVPKPPKNTKDPAKIEAAIQEKIQERIETAALDSDLATIKCIAWQVGVDGEPRVSMVSDVTTELNLLDEFWHVLAECSQACIGYNIIGFDIPFIMKRSFELGSRPSTIPNLAKFRTEPITDMFPILNNWAYSGGKPLKWIAKRYGIEIPYPDVSGPDSLKMEDPELVKYALSDLYVTKELYKRMNGYYFRHF